MKNFKLLLVATFIVMVAGFQNLSAQQTVNINATHEYWVTATGSNTYNFEVLVMPAGTAAPVGDYAISTVSAARREITWNTTGSYRIRVTETSPAPANCSGTPVTYNITVSPAGTVQFASAGPATTNCSATGNQTVTLSVSAGVAYPISLTLTTIIDGATTANVPITIASGTTFNIADLGLNTFTGNRSNSLEITAASAAGGGTLNIGTTDTYTVPVYGTPSTTGITHN